MRIFLVRVLLSRFVRRCYRSASHWHRSVLSYFILGQYGYIHKDSRKISIFTRRDVEANEHKKEKSHFIFRTKQKSRNNKYFISSIIKWIKDVEVLMEWISNVLILKKLVTNWKCMIKENKKDERLKTTTSHGYKIYV
jgi:hypothetical protein